MTSKSTRGRLLTVGQAAERLGTGERFVRRLVAERRIEFVRVGRHVRIAESAVERFIEERTVQPRPTRYRGRGAA